MKIVGRAIILFLIIGLSTIAHGQSDTIQVNEIEANIEDNSTEAGDVRIGVQINPVTSWLSSNDKTIISDGNSSGLRIAVFGEKYFQPNYSLFGSLGYVTNQGGSLTHDQGGNLLPNSDLSDPAFNTGQKPLPDGTTLTYHIDYIEFLAGLRLKTNSIGRKRGLRIYTELPFIGLNLAVRSRGEIESSTVNSDDESVGKDTRNLMLFWGIGGGIELTLKSGLTLVGGVAYQKSFTDVTRNNGNKAFDLIDDMGTTDPTDDVYNIDDENARNLLNGLTIRLGMFF